MIAILVIWGTLVAVGVVLVARKLFSLIDALQEAEARIAMQRIHDDITAELLTCSECGEDVHTVPAEGVPNQMLRGCLGCDAVFIMDMNDKPRFREMA